MFIVEFSLLSFSVCIWSILKPSKCHLLKQQQQPTIKTFFNHKLIQIQLSSSCNTFARIQYTNGKKCHISIFRRSLKDCIKGLKIRRINAYCRGAAVQEASQYTREKKSLSCIAARVLRQLYRRAAVEGRLFILPLQLRLAYCGAAACPGR